MLLDPGGYAVVVIGLVPRASLIGILFDCYAVKIRALILKII